MRQINSLHLSGPEPSRLQAFRVAEKSLVVVLDRLIEHSFHYNPPILYPFFVAPAFFMIFFLSLHVLTLLNKKK